jgi:hypothetical protein
VPGLLEHRWHANGESPYEWEREALEYLRQALPDREPWHVWPIFEFIADTGAVYEVDSLVLSQCGLWLMEIKSHPGSLRGDH